MRLSLARRLLAATALVTLAACTQQQQDQIATLCAIAAPLAQAATPLPVAGPYIAVGVTVGCSTAEGLAKLRADPTSAIWLAQQITFLKDALAKGQ